MLTNQGVFLLVYEKGLKENQKLSGILVTVLENQETFQDKGAAKSNKNNRKKENKQKKKKREKKKNSIKKESKLIKGKREKKKKKARHIKTEVIKMFYVTKQKPNSEKLGEKK